MNTTTREQDTVNKFNQASKDFVDKLTQFRPEDFNRVPYQDSWTPAQVAEHVFKSVNGAARGLMGSVAETDRDPGQLIPHFEQVFLDFETKLKSPDFILPTDDLIDKQQMVGDLDSVFSDVKNAALSADLSKTCMDFKFPGSGHVTGLELVHFLYVHTKRHAHQLDKIAAAF